jgi:hypothetical protein
MSARTSLICDEMSLTPALEPPPRFASAVGRSVVVTRARTTPDAPRARAGANARDVFISAAVPDARADDDARSEVDDDDRGGRHARPTRRGRALDAATEVEDAIGAVAVDIGNVRPLETERE